jgi:hypothetical protein
MKRTRRISIEIEHRELSFSITQATGGHVTETFQSSPGSNEEPPSLCPICGASWLLLLDATAARQENKGKTIQEILLTYDFHLHTSPSGALWACRRSFQNVKGNL